MTDLTTRLAGVTLKNPVIAASGTFGYGREYEGLVDPARLGAICTKGLTLRPRPGNPGTRLWETPSGLLNSIGLENPGVPGFIERELPLMRRLGTVIIANLAGETVDDYARGAALLDEAGVGLIELNISCPNVEAGGAGFGVDPAAAAAVTRAARRAAAHTPLMVKLTPSAPDLVGVARACLAGGADALSLVNTFRGMAIDVERRRPVFDRVTAGLSGPAIRPLALALVWQLREAFPAAPLVGLGGVASAVDALEFLAAGAVAVQVGTATFSRPATMAEVIDGIAAYMQRHGMERVSEIALSPDAQGNNR